MPRSIIIVAPPAAPQIDGVATYCSFLAKGLAQTGLYDVHVVTPTPEETSFPISVYSGKGNLFHYKCPLSPAGEGVGIYLKCIPAGESPIVFLNYWPSIFNVRSIRTHLPEAGIVQVVHDLPWLTVFDGKPEAFFRAYAADFSAFPIAERKFLKYSTYDTLVSFREADHIICLCNGTRDVVNLNYQIPLDKIHLIPNGMKDSKPEDKPFISRQTEEITGLKILFSGRPTISKGWDRVIALADYFKRAGIDAKIICAGFPDITKHVPENLSAFFVGLGILPQQKLYDLYRQVDFVFIPSRHEQCSYTAIEAMMHGCEIVAFKSFGLTDMLTHECAYIIENPCQFPLRSSKMGPAARRRYLERYAGGIMIGNYIEFLSSLS